MAETNIHTHCLTVDVEDYFQVAAFRHSISLADWDRMPSRVEPNTATVLELFDELGVKATFFVLGWVAEKHPAIVRRISQAGHELGCHSYSHQLIYDLGPEAFRQDTIRALDAIQQASGERVTCYRAPSFSVTTRSLWALDILLEAGFTHDSSIFPIHHDLYGFPGAPDTPFALRTNGGALIEFPPSTISFLNIRFPFTGGGYLRSLPLALQKKCLRTLENRGVPAMMYLHPWELDPEQPRIKAPLRSRLRHYTGLQRTASRISSLSRDFRFEPLGKVLPASLPVFQLNENGEFRSCPAEAAASDIRNTRPEAQTKEIQPGVNVCL
jgi:polysaccharide deacetylase family protein (PEP-CTERM system associated)